jgi:hypothetical protein
MHQRVVVAASGSDLAAGAALAHECRGIMTDKLTAGPHTMLASLSAAAPAKHVQAPADFDEVIRAFAAQQYRRACEGL